MADAARNEARNDALLDAKSDAEATQLARFHATEDRRLTEGLMTAGVAGSLPFGILGAARGLMQPGVVRGTEAARAAEVEAPSPETERAMEQARSEARTSVLQSEPIQSGTDPDVLMELENDREAVKQALLRERTGTAPRAPINTSATADTFVFGPGLKTLGYTLPETYAQLLEDQRQLGPGFSEAVDKARAGDPTELGDMLGRLAEQEDADDLRYVAKAVRGGSTAYGGPRVLGQDIVKQQLTSESESLSARIASIEDEFARGMKAFQARLNAAGSAAAQAATIEAASAYAVKMRGILSSAATGFAKEAVAPALSAAFGIPLALYQQMEKSSDPATAFKEFAFSKAKPGPLLVSDMDDYGYGILMHDPALESKLHLAGILSDELHTMIQNDERSGPEREAWIASGEAKRQAEEADRRARAKAAMANYERRAI